MSKKNNQGYLPALDHLRILAAALVLLFHGVHFIWHDLQFGGAYNPANWPVGATIAQSVAIEGHTGVSLFFVLSAFIFTVLLYDSRIDYVGFIRNRFLRTYPLFLLVLLIGLLSNISNFDVLPLLKSLFFMGNLPSAFNGGVFTFVTWSIAIEWQFYLVFPFLIWLIRPHPWAWLLGLVIAMIVVRFVVWQNVEDLRQLAYWTMVGRFDQFLIGMIAGVYYKKYFVPSIKLDVVAVVSSVLLVLLLSTFNRLGGGGTTGYYWVLWPSIEALFWSVFCVSYLSIANRINKHVSVFLSGLGAISYSIYLSHFPIISLFMEYEWDRVLVTQQPMTTAIVNTVVVIFPVVIGFSLISYLLIEKPILKFKRKYSS